MKKQEPELEEESSFKTLGTDIDEAYSQSWNLDSDIDDLDLEDEE